MHHKTYPSSKCISMHTPDLNGVRAELFPEGGCFGDEGVGEGLPESVCRLFGQPSPRDPNASTHNAPGSRHTEAECSDSAVDMSGTSTRQASDSSLHDLSQLEAAIDRL